MGNAVTHRGRLENAALALARGICALTVLAGIGFSIRGVVELEKDTTTDSRRQAWSSSEQERMRVAVGGWYPFIEGLSNHVPRRAVIWCWTGYPAPLSMLLDLFNLFRMCLAPRLLMPVFSPDAVALQPRLNASGLPVYFLEIHPSFAPQGAEIGPIAPVIETMRAWPVVQRHADFTLRFRDLGR